VLTASSTDGRRSEIVSESITRVPAVSEIKPRARPIHLTFFSARFFPSRAIGFRSVSFSVRFVFARPGPKRATANVPEHLQRPWRSDRNAWWRRRSSILHERTVYSRAQVNHRRQPQWMFVGFEIPNNLLIMASGF